MNLFTSLLTFLVSALSSAATINISNKLIIKSNSEKLILEIQDKSLKYLAHPSQAHYLDEDLYIHDIPAESLKHFIKEIQKNTNIRIEHIDPKKFKTGTQDDMT